MIDFLYFTLFFILSVYSFISIRQDFNERKVSNKITFSLFLIGFFLFVYRSNLLVWIDYIMIFSTFLISYILYKKNVWGAADGKIFLAVMLILISFAHSEMFLRWVMNLTFFYAITILIVSLFRTSKKVKLKTFKKLDYVDSSLVILTIFIVIDILFTFYVVPDKNAAVMIIFFLTLFAFLYKIKKYLLKNFKKMFGDVKLMAFALLFMWNFLYSGMGMFIFHFCLVLVIKTLISFVSELSGKIKNSDGTLYESPFSLYLFLTAIFTLITNKSFVEILVLFFY